jgi:alkylation response protein AidB-like acyl-CoA dehydrogenase
MDGEHHLNQVQFDDVRVPLENRIGEQDKGWTYAKSLLALERSAIAGVAGSKCALVEVCELAARETNGGRRLLDDSFFQAQLAEVDIDLMALEVTEMRVLSAAAGGAVPGPESAILKLKGTVIQQALQQLYMEIAAHYGGVLPNDLSAAELGHDFGCRARQRFLLGRAASIYGGSTEVQKSIVAKSVLGLK